MYIKGHDKLVVTQRLWAQVTEEFVGAVLNDLAVRRGIILEVGSDRGWGGRWLQFYSHTECISNEYS